jgi:hypothetical protein
MIIINRKHEPQTGVSPATFNYFWLTCFTFLLCILLSTLHPNAVLADDPLTFLDTQPPAVMEGEDYTWKISVNGGKPPYTIAVVGTLPPGLIFDPSKSAITGKLQKGIQADKYTVTIKAKDSAATPAAIDSSITINLNYISTISLTTTLSAGEANVYIDDQLITKLQGGGKINRSFKGGTKHTVAVDVTSSTIGKEGTRFKSTADKIVIDQLSPDAIFDFYPEFEIRIKANQQGVPQIAGSGWYKEGSSLTSTAPAEIEAKTGTQYRFAYWTLPSGEILANPILNWKVTRTGDVVATYEIYYLLTVDSEHSEVEGPGWYKTGSKARWTIKYSAVPVPGFWGSVGVELKPQKDTGTVVMNSPQVIDVEWKEDYSRIIIPITAAVIGAIAFPIIAILHRRTTHVITKIKGQDNRFR